jgi:signal transduction histidine kinase
LTERQNQAQLANVNAQIEAANAQLRQYALRIEDLATVQERNRIAREIHDALGHSLTVFNLHLEAALRLLETDPAEAKDLLIEAKQLGKAALNEVRQSVSALRSNPLQTQPLTVAITALVAEFQRSTGITPICKLEFDESISGEIKIAIYRIVQESLTNIYKYAEATMVKIEVTTLDQVLQALIEDNGKGFNLDQNTTGFGLQGMRERAQALGGNLEILTDSETGCRVILRCPLS